MELAVSRAASSASSATGKGCWHKIEKFITREPPPPLHLQQPSSSKEISILVVLFLISSQNVW